MKQQRSRNEELHSIPIIDSRDSEAEPDDRNEPEPSRAIAQGSKPYVPLVHFHEIHGIRTHSNGKARNQ